MAEYEEMAAIESRHVLEALIARHNARMLAMAEIPPEAIKPVMSALLTIGYMDFAFRELGVNVKRPPSSYGGNWIDHLAWGTDSVYAAARLLFCGQFLGAATILRSQFERWAENAAYNTGVVHKQGESAASYAGRAWAKCHANYPFARRSIRPVDSISDVAARHSWDEEVEQHSPDGPSVTIGRDYTVYPVQLMESMSNFLHGHGPWVDLVHWEAGQLLSAQAPSSLAEASETLSDVITLILRQIRLCLAALAEEQGMNDLPLKILSSSLERQNGGEEPPRPHSLFPLLPTSGLQEGTVAGLEDAAKAHSEVMRGKRPAGRLYRDDEFAHLHFYERRARAAKWALTAFDMEKEGKGELDFKNLDGRNFRYIVASEMAGSISIWLNGTPAGDAAASCSSALRTAYWLWLEDDDRALASLRIVLEQCARMRVWTEKPEKAEKLQSSSATTPKDWVKAAGWNRLSALTRALGEFSHSHANVRLDGAREILEKIQREGLDAEDSIHLARGHALDALTILLLGESINTAKKLSPSIGNAFMEIVDDVLMDKGALAKNREDLFNRTLAQKDAPRGDYSFHGPASALRQDRQMKNS
ncbi:hypothetical protein GCM10010372_83730 [Streptomyces tauricus]|uniref:hypothetical protein n=1 Tax=Streptomyces tauricus TaxID=68274 RepID=UPI0016770C83|nr:hypothetical protein [Streptomyces tauricus]GHA72100.1 hypothetical protein GCM10010372_83730 [Streptomyces tauricus]